MFTPLLVPCDQRDLTAIAVEIVKEETKWNGNTEIQIACPKSRVGASDAVPICLMEDATKPG